MPSQVDPTFAFFTPFSVLVFFYFINVIKFLFNILFSGALYWYALTILCDCRTQACGFQ